MALFREPAYLTDVSPASDQYGMPLFVRSSPSIPSNVHELYLDGFADTTGDVEWAGGHYYRVEQYVVHTDTLGFMTLFEFATWMDAHSAFVGVERQYAACLGDDPDMI